MDPRLLARTDLNLLKALQVLLEEKHVTRAAERLFITQPAMSKTLQRLRALFGDELFTRSGKGLIPTPKADEIALQLPDILTSIESLIDQSDFDPTQYTGEIKIMAAAFMAYQFIPQLVAELQELAPGMTVAVTSGPVQTLQKDLELGDLDFAVTFATSQPPGIRSTRLGAITPSVWMRSGHPLSGYDDLVLDDILGYPFVQYHLMHSGKVSRMTDTRFDKAISNVGLKRQRLLVTNQFLTAAETLLRSDCLMLGALNESLVRSAYQGELIRKAYPKELRVDSDIPVDIHQHIRTESSPAHNWLKQQIFSVMRTATSQL